MQFPLAFSGSNMRPKYITRDPQGNNRKKREGKLIFLDLFIYIEWNKSVVP
jgi:hypothetical protein